MNKPFEIDEETRFRMAQHEGEVIELFARMGTMQRPIPRLDDRDRNEEWLLQAQLENAIKLMRQAIAAVNERSTVGVKIDGMAFEAFVHDDIISDRSWDEKISEGRIK